MKKILFITPNLARTGSEMVLWYLLNQLDPNQYQVHVFCMEKGELYNQLPNHIEKSVLFKKDSNWKNKIFRAYLKVIGTDPFAYQIRSIHQQLNPDCWYINTITIPQVYPMAKRLGAKVVTHFHELLHAFTFIQHDQLQQIITGSKTCIACSTEVLEKVKEMGHPDVRLQNSFIDTHTIHVNPKRVAEIREELGILPSDFVWVISGVVSYMKGLDYIIPILKAFNHLPVKIIWIGKLLNTGLDFYVKRVAENEFPGKLIFTDALSTDYYDYMAMGNGYLSVSREECLSLAMLEAAYLGLPIVSVNVGIAASFVQDGMGKVIYGSKVEDITAAMDWLHHHPHQNPQKLKAAAMEYSLERQLPPFEALINDVIHGQDH